jgi:hypothetical protein
MTVEKSNPTSGLRSNGIRNRKGYAYDANILPTPSPPEKQNEAAVEDGQSSSTNFTLERQMQQQRQNFIQSLLCWNEFLRLVLFPICVSLIILVKVTVRCSDDGGVWKMTSPSKSIATTKSAVGSTPLPRHRHEPRKDDEEEEISLRGSFTKHHPETRFVNLFSSSIELEEEEGSYGVSLTAHDEAYAELPFSIVNCDSKSIIMSLWVKLLTTPTAPKRRILWTTSTGSDYGMTFLLERDDLHQYWWKVEYGASLINSTVSEGEHLHSFAIAPIQEINHRLKNHTNSSNVHSGFWRHVALSLKVCNSTTKASISLFENGILVGQKSQIPVPTALLYDRNRKKIPGTRTTLGRASLPTTGVASATYHLHGYLALMAVWYYDDNEEEDHTNTLIAKEVKHVYNIGISTTTSDKNHRRDFYRTYYQLPRLGCPTYFYPFDDAVIMKRDNPEVFLHIELESSYKLKEWIQNNRAVHGTFFRRVPIPHFQPLGGYRYTQYKEGTFTSPETYDTQAREESDRVARKRRVHVRNAMRHAWNGYRTYAWGYDELRPQSKKGNNNWGAQATTKIDSLSTLWLMGLKEEFYEARDWIRDHLSYDHVGEVSVFETTIRNLGGLLAAFDVSDDVTFLQKADDLGSRLLRSITDSPSGIPYGMTVLNDTSVKGKSYNQRWLGNNAVLAELGTIQLEFRYLAAATGKKEYATAVNKILKVVGKINPRDGLYSIYIKNDVQPCFGGLPHVKISFGAMGDSFYEYMLKVWLQGGKQETILRNMYDRAMDGLHNRMIRKSFPSGLTYIAELVGDAVDRKMDHLACFMGGMYGPVSECTCLYRFICAFSYLNHCVFLLFFTVFFFSLNRVASTRSLHKPRWSGYQECSKGS